MCSESSVRVVGIMPHMTEKNKMWRLVYALLERQSIFHYGRIELNLLMSEREYLVRTHTHHTHTHTPHTTHLFTHS